MSLNRIVVVAAALSLLTACSPTADPSESVSESAQPTTVSPSASASPASSASASTSDYDWGAMPPRGFDTAPALTGSLPAQVGEWAGEPRVSDFGTVIDYKSGTKSVEADWWEQGQSTYKQAVEEMTDAAYVGENTCGTVDELFSVCIRVLANGAYKAQTLDLTVDELATLTDELIAAAVSG